MINTIGQKILSIILHRAMNFVIIFLIVFCAFIYIFIVNITVQKISLLQKIEKEIASLNADISEMESVQLIMDNNLTNEMAKTLGFVEVKDKNFLFKKSPKVSFSFKIK